MSTNQLANNHKQVHPSPDDRARGPTLESLPTAASQACTPRPPPHPGCLFFRE